MYGIPIIALMVVLAGCATKPERPTAASSSTFAAAPTSTSAKVPAPVQENAADTIDVGTSGVRCLVGKETVACVTMEHKGMVAEGKRAFSFIRTDNPHGGVELGFAPGQHVENIAPGDLLFIDTSNCQHADAPEPNVSTANCNTFTISSSVNAANSKNIIIGIISKVSAAGLTVDATDTVFDLPVPPPAQAGQAVYRPNPGQQLNSGQSITVRDYWNFKLDDKTLTIGSPQGVTNVDV